MSAKQIKVWYWILAGEFLFASFVFFSVAFFAESLGIDCSGGWGLRRILIAGLGLALAVFSLLLCVPRIKTAVQINSVAQSVRYTTKSTGWVLLGLSACELVLQITVAPIPEMNYEKDWGNVPVAGSTLFWNHEGYGITHYLSHGEIATPFDDGGLSVVVLGDSHTEALQVSDAENFVSLAETNLRKQGKDVNLHNLGKSGNDIPDYIYFAPLIKKYYKPDIVVVQLTVPDGRDAFVLDYNYFVINSAGDLELRHKEAACVPGINSQFQKFKLRIIGLSLVINRYFQITKNGLDSVQTPQPAGMDASMGNQLKLLKEAYSGTRLVLLLLPFSPTLDKNTIQFDDPEYQALLKSAQQVGGVDVINTQPALNLLVKQGDLPRGFINTLPGVGHLNTFGHKVVGALLARKISEIIP